AFDGEFGVFLDSHLDLCWERVNDGVRIAEAQVDGLTLNGSFETDALDFELLHEPFADAADHVVNERAAEAVQRFGLGVIALAADDDFAAIDFEAGAAGQFPIELAFGSFDRDLLAFDLDFDFGR